MADTYEDIAERLAAKTGPELFKELLRVYETAEVEDYFKGGVWKDELMRTDIQLIDRHRREAGAPEAPDLSEVEMPNLPKGMGGLASMVRPALGGAASAAGGAASVGGAVAELRLIALFVAKWKLDASRTKTALAKLLPARRRYVIANFKTSASEAESTAELEKYIAECDATNAWGAATAAAAASAPVAPTGVKRPISAVSGITLDPSKRFRPATPVAAYRPPAASPSPAAVALAQRLAAAKPRPVTPVRPVNLGQYARPIIRPVVTSVRPAVARPAAWGGPTVRSATPRPVSIIRPGYGTPIRPVSFRPLGR